MAFLSKPDRKVSQRAQEQRPPRPPREPRPTLAQLFDKLLEQAVLGETPGLVALEIRGYWQAGRLKGRGLDQLKGWKVEVGVPTVAKMWEAREVVEAALVEWAEGRIVKVPGGIYRRCPACEQRRRVGRPKKGGQSGDKQSEGDD